MYLLIALFLNYYAHCQGLQDSLLKEALTDSISQGVRYEYGTNQYHSGYDPTHPKGEFKAYGTWEAFAMTDVREDGTIWDMYSNAVRYFPYKKGESACNTQIEHCLPKSWWGWNTTQNEPIDSVAYKDLFNLNPSDAQANGQKSNYPPGMVDKADKFDNGLFRMSKTNKSKGIIMCFEPDDAYKGDFARTYFYVVTAYAHASWSKTDTTNINPARYTMLSPKLTQLLLDWHRNDPVSEKEIHRASVITSIQHNHNPFIDYPELVEYIWGNKKGTAVDFNQLTCTYDSTYVPPVFPRPQTDRYDTLINLSGVNSDAIKAIANSTSYKLVANGSQSVTMGSSTTDGYIQFSNLTFKDSAWLVVRASIFRTAATMQLDIYVDDTYYTSISDSAILSTRHEQVYTIALPATTKTVKLLSVGGSTDKRACLQEIYLLTNRFTSDLYSPKESRQARKLSHNHQIFIRTSNATYNILGQAIPAQ